MSSFAGLLLCARELKGASEVRESCDADEDDAAVLVHRN
jgi:hypothetical protein